MTIARIGLAGTALLTLLTSAALAEQGMVTKIDRLNHMISIQPTQSGTVGANTGSALGRLYRNHVIEAVNLGHHALLG